MMADRALLDDIGDEMARMLDEEDLATPSPDVDYRTLQAMRDSTMGRIEALKSRLRTQPEAGSHDEGDDADQASDLYDRSQMAWLIQTLEAKVHELDHAIERALEGQYGVCARCGQPIPPERLALVPETEFCVACANARERVANREVDFYERQARRAAARYAVEAMDEDEDE